MQGQTDTIVRVQTEWNGWRTASVRLTDLHEIHWSQPHGAPRQLVHGYVSCANIAAGDLPHDCDGQRTPHNLLVCVLRSHTSAVVYADLERRANARLMASGAIEIPLPHAQGQTMMPFRTA